MSEATPSREEITQALETLRRANLVSTETAELVLADQPGERILIAVPPAPDAEKVWTLKRLSELLDTAREDGSLALFQLAQEVLNILMTAAHGLAGANSEDEVDPGQVQFDMESFPGMAQRRVTLTFQRLGGPDVEQPSDNETASVLLAIAELLDAAMLEPGQVLVMDRTLTNQSLTGDQPITQTIEQLTLRILNMVPEQPDTAKPEQPYDETSDSGANSQG